MWYVKDQLPKKHLPGKLIDSLSIQGTIPLSIHCLIQSILYPVNPCPPPAAIRKESY